MSGRAVAVRWHGRRVDAWVPDPLTDRDLSVSEPTARRTEQAAAAARRGSDELPARWEPLARLLLRAEGVASSFLEGVRAPLADVAAAELDPTLPGETAKWVADNLAAVTAAIEQSHGSPLSTAALHHWHRTVIAGTSHLLPEHLGRFREVQGWIGGTSPLDAALVTPPPGEIDGLMGDLVAFVNRDDLDPVTQAAVAHAQFEVIHPYVDGNGRVGRVLVVWLLTRRLRLVSPPPVSVRIALDRGGYLSGLKRFRLGEVDPWIAWFADVVHDAGDATVNLVRAIAALETRWNERLAGVRVDAAARRTLALLPAHPVVTASTIADETGISARAARNALATLAERGIVEPFDPRHRAAGRPRHWWVARELVDLVADW